MNKVLRNIEALIKQNYGESYGSLKRFAEDCGLRYSTVNNWFQRDSIPDLKSLLKISDTFKVNLDSLTKRKLNLVWQTVRHRLPMYRAGEVFKMWDDLPAEFEVRIGDWFYHVGKKANLSEDCVILVCNETLCLVGRQSVSGEGFAIIDLYTAKPTRFTMEEATTLQMARVLGRRQEFEDPEPSSSGPSGSISIGQKEEEDGQ